MVQGVRLNASPLLLLWPVILKLRGEKTESCCRFFLLSYHVSLDRILPCFFISVFYNLGTCHQTSPHVLLVSSRGNLVCPKTVTFLEKDPCVPIKTVVIIFFITNSCSTGSIFTKPTQTQLTTSSFTINSLKTCNIRRVISQCVLMCWKFVDLLF